VSDSGEIASAPVWAGRDAELIRRFIDSLTDDAICAVDPDGLVTSWNAAAERLTEYPRAEIVGRPFALQSTPDDRAAGTTDRALAVAVAEGRCREQRWLVRRSGSQFWAEVVTTAVRADDERLLGFGVVTRDLTERKRAEDALRASEEKFRSLVTSVADYAIFLLDLDGRIASWNVGAERLKGYTVDEIIGRHLSTFYTEEDRSAGVPERALQVARDVGRWESEGWRVRKDGTRFWANVVITALRHDDGELWGYAKVTRDLTERKRNEDALRGVLAREREAAERLRQADQLRREVVAVVAHDLSAPIQVVQGLVHLMGDDVDASADPSRAELVARIQRRLDEMSRLVGDIFETSRIEAGLIDSELADIEVVPLVERLVQDLRVSRPGRDIEVDVGTTGSVRVDERRIVAVLDNLLTNAVKFSPPGSTVDVVVGGDERTVRISVRDRGPGIPEDEQARVFDRFVRGASAAPGSGSGLGLYIARTFTEAMGGTLSLGSAVGEGSTFHVTLPRAPAP
jgi:PAS domain S-box-containing protein